MFKLKHIVPLVLATMSSDSNITFDGKYINAAVYTQECYVTLTISALVSQKADLSPSFQFITLNVAFGWNPCRVQSMSAFVYDYK